MRPPTRPEHQASRAQGTEAARLWLLGGFRVSVGSKNIPSDAWRLKKAAALVKLLALASGHRMHREQIVNILWPDSGRRTASNNLRKTLHAARRTLDPAAGSLYLVSQDESLVLWPGGDLRVDVDALEEAAATARRSRDPAAYRAAIEFYAGELLPEDRYEEWAEGRREQLRRLYLDLLIELAALYEGRDRYDAAVEVLRKAIAEEPTNEDAHSGLMRTYALLGRRADALAQFEHLKEVLSTHLGAEPGAETTRLHGELVAGTFPPARSQPGATPSEPPPDGARHNLPASRDSFVGRERELREVKRELAMTRLLTLAGPGGSGKTRLALEVARDLVGAYPDGVWLVELAPLTEEAMVPQAVASALGVQEQPSQRLIDTLAEALRTKETLLVLDNCEHLVEAAASLVDALLGSSPHLRVLATSREGLDVAGEVRWPVPPLAVPASRRPLTVEQLEGYESARLFVERASGRRPGFVVAAEHAGAVAQVCRRLDGVPLAIELAAARVGTLSVEQISERLEDPLDLLTGGGRTRTSRQRTLRATLDWSHDLLSEPEQTLFRRLSLFTGGWTLEAAETVTSGNGVGRDDVLDLVSELVNKSLVVPEISEDGTPRYSMLEPVRQYAQAKIAEEGGEAEEVRRKHAEFFLALIEEAEPKFLGPEEAACLERLEADHDNLRNALAWAFESGEAELGLRLAGAAQEFWEARGYNVEALRWLEAALAMDGPTSEEARVKALDGLGWTMDHIGDHDGVQAAAEEGLKLLANAGIEGSHEEASFLILLAQMTLNRGDSEQAIELSGKSLALSRKAGDVRGISSSLLSLGHVSLDKGDYERATSFYEEGVALCQQADYKAPLAEHLGSLGYTLLLQGDHERATALNEEVANLYREQGRRAGLETALDNLGWAAIVRGDYERAKVLHTESLTLCRELKSKAVAAESLEGLACADAARGEAEHAARLFGAAEMLRRMVGYRRQPIEKARREPYLTAVRSRLDEASWEDAHSEGRAMSFEAAIEYALSEESASALAPTGGLPYGAKSGVLTLREEEVATLVARGLNNRRIASKLSISEHTAATHVRRIFKKLGFHSRAELASWVSTQQSSSLP